LRAILFSLLFCVFCSLPAIVRRLPDDGWPFCGYYISSSIIRVNLRKSAACRAIAKRRRIHLRLTSVFVSIRVHSRFVFALFVPLADVAKGGDGATCPP
jgi:hypothetical protein